jgi:osmotically inducible lipoprotein OsmB
MAQMRASLIRLTVIASIAVALSGCGYRPGDRAASGALLGAAGGAAISAVVGGDPLLGAALGGAAGAVGGAATSHRTINLGRPAWR